MNKLIGFLLFLTISTHSMEFQNSETLALEQSYNHDGKRSFRFIADSNSKEFCFALTTPSEPSSYVPLKTIKLPLNRHPFGQELSKLKALGMFKFRDETFGIAYAKIPGEFQLSLIPFKSKINTAVMGLAGKIKSVSMKKLKNGSLVAELVLENQKKQIETIALVYADDLTKMKEAYTLTESGYKKLDW